jgi:hypothetical protein
LVKCGFRIKLSSSNGMKIWRCNDLHGLVARFDDLTFISLSNACCHIPYYLSNTTKGAFHTNVRTFILKTPHQFDSSHSGRPDLRARESLGLGIRRDPSLWVRLPEDYSQDECLKRVNLYATCE